MENVWHPTQTKTRLSIYGVAVCRESSRTDRHPEIRFRSRALPRPIKRPRLPTTDRRWASRLLRSGVLGMDETLTYSDFRPLFGHFCFWCVRVFSLVRNWMFCDRRASTSHSTFSARHPPGVGSDSRPFTAPSGPGASAELETRVLFRPFLHVVLHKACRITLYVFFGFSHHLCRSQDAPSAIRWRSALLVGAGSVRRGELQIAAIGSHLHVCRSVQGVSLFALSDIGVTGVAPGVVCFASENRTVAIGSARDFSSDHNLSGEATLPGRGARQCRQARPTQTAATAPTQRKVMSRNKKSLYTMPFESCHFFEPCVLSAHTVTLWF